MSVLTERRGRVDRILDFTLEHPLAVIFGPAILVGYTVSRNQALLMGLMLMGSLWVFACFVYYFFFMRDSGGESGGPPRRRHLIVVRLEEHIEHKPVRRAA